MRTNTLVRISLFVLQLLLSSCSETVVPAGTTPASAKPSQATTPSGASEGPRYCTTPKEVCPYGVGPAGVPCSCWSNEGGAPHLGVTTK